MPGTSGTPAARISRFADALSPSRSITSGERADEDEVVLRAGAGEGRVLGEEAVAGVDASQPVVAAAAITLGMRR